MPRARAARAAAALLLHVNLLLAAYGGVALATAARLKWDPSTYVVIRGALPREYRAAAAALAGGGAALLALTHLGAAAAAARGRAARRAYITFAAAMSLLLCLELAFCAWLWLALAAWLRSPAAAELLQALELRAHVRPLLAHLARWHPLPAHLDALLQEASADAPCNAYVALALGALLALLQPGAVLLATLAAPAAPVAPAAGTRALAPRARSSNSTLCGRVLCCGGRALPACVTFVVNIYYREKSAAAALDG